MESRQKCVAWSNDEVQVFLSIIGDCNIQRQLDRATCNEKVFVEVAERMAGAGYSRTSPQCQEKLKNLKRDYKAIKDPNGRSGSNRKQWGWFDHMDAIYGHRPASCGREGGMDSATSLLEDMCGESIPSSVVPPIETHADTDSPSCLAALEPSCSSSSAASHPDMPSTPLMSNQQCRSGKRRREDDYTEMRNRRSDSNVSSTTVPGWTSSRRKQQQEERIIVRCSPSAENS
ncbi:uncharacterized protein LOC119616816 [Kryptolebias marmoratus]|uniref:uncharacterized protein LOC119616816 n=1 Tax=Kryptolebias marmoratus TaxID=37003 RepID=UPI0018ACBEB2|nr:uncharacterized protein LOC119616816 [Kryptolebias marmoratus]